MFNIKFIQNKIILLNYQIKFLILLFLDQFILNTSFIYYFLLFNQSISIEFLIFNNIIFFLINLFSKHNFSVLRFLAMNNYIDIIIFLIKYLIFSILFDLIFYQFLHIKLFIISLPFLSLVLLFSRFFIYLIVKENFQKNNFTVLLYGSGKVANHFISNNTTFQICGIIDDDKSKYNRLLKGIKIYSPSKIHFLKEKFNFTKVFIAINNLSTKRKNEIFDFLSQLNVSINIIDSVENNISNKIINSNLRNINFDDLVNREINWNKIKIKNIIYSKIILITGAGGTIGSNLALYLLTFNPKKLILIDHSEYGLYQISQKIENLNTGQKNFDISYITASVCDNRILTRIFKSNPIDCVFHAAAYKHVPLQEFNPLECIQNNVLPTYDLARLALKHNVKNFKLISTDKAVRPTNIMGASKRLAEMIVQFFSEKKSKTIFSIVRFGNVIGSSGSAFPLFLEQINQKRSITITHKNVTRYFMTAKEAIGLILESTHMAKGGEVFLLNMGSPIKILDLAKKMINVMGYSIKGKSNPTGDISIKITGLRPGEKLYEELLIKDNPIATENNDIYKAKENFIKLSDASLLIKDLKNCISQNNINKISKILSKFVDGYKNKYY